MARILESTGRYGKALEIYQDALALYPGNLTILLPYTKTMLVAGKSAEAYKLLSDISKDHYTNPEIFKLLAQAAEATGRAVQSHSAMSQYYFLNGYTKQAIQQLQLAAREPDASDYESARIQARLKELEALLEEEKKMN